MFPQGYVIWAKAHSQIIQYLQLKLEAIEADSQLIIAFPEVYLCIQVATGQAHW